MKKSKLIPVLVLASTFVMAGCGDNNEKCSHVDANKDHLCDKCGEKISDHSAKSEWKFDSVNHWHECSFDGCSVMVDKAAHSFGEWEIVTQPTFESAGQMKRSCSCGYSQVKGIPQLIHEYDLEVWSHDEHTHWHACKDSGYEDLKAFESEHEFGKLIVDKEPTCNEDGSGHYICSVCGEILDVVIPATGHVNVKFHPEFAPTCTHEGHKAYYTCANEPGVYFEDEECTIVIDDISIAKLAHVPERHEAVAPTCDNPGNKEYWTCANEPGVLYADEACSVKISEADIIIPATGHDFAEEWSFDDDNHWHECKHDDCKEVSGLAAHVDDDGDCYCDVCEKELDGVESLSIISPVSYMGRGEMIELSSSVVTHGAATSDVEFSITDTNDSSVFSLTDNEDGTASLSATEAEATATNEKYAVITLTSKYDSKKTATFKIFASTYGSTKRNTITSFFGGDYQFIPYFVGTSFTKNGDVLEQVSANSNGHVTFEKVLAAFKNQGTWAVISQSTDSATLKIDNPKDLHTYFKAEMVRNGTGTNITYSKETVVYAKFPTEFVNEVISSGTTSTLVEPDDGTEFTFAKISSNATVTSNGDASAYISKLTSNNYYVVDSGSSKVCVSPERTLKVTISELSSGFKAVYSTQKAPTKTAWASADSEKMIALIGEEIPFVANDYGSWYKDDSYMYASSTRLEAPAVAIETLDKASGYTKTVKDDGVYYSKDINSYSSYSIVVDGTELYIYVVPKEVTSWLGEELASALKVSSLDIPEAVGTSYLYMFGNETAEVQVNGGDLDEYKLSLTSASYTIIEKKNSLGIVTATNAVSSDRTIVIQLTSLDSGFGLSFSKQSPIEDIDWSEKDKQIMNDFMGDVLPYVGGFAGKWYSSADQIYATSTRIEAQVAAKAVFDADTSFVFDDKTSTDANLVYTKAISKYLNIIVKVSSGGMITVTKENAKLSTWEADAIAAALGSEPKETLPVFEEEGATFSYEFGEDEATIYVFTDSSATSMANYKDALALAEFTTEDNATFKSPTDTLTVVVSKVANKQFKIVATGHLPEGQYRNLPTDLIAKQLNNDAGLGDLALPEGDLFFYEAKDKYQCDVTVLEGGSMSAYISALEEKGFALKDTAYEKEGNNIRIVLTAGEGDVYSAHLSLIEEPVITGWSDEIKEVITNIINYNWLSFSAEDLPYPSDATSVEKLSTKSFKVTGIDMTAYKAQLEEAGFTVYYYDSYGEYDAYYGDDYSAIYILDQYDGSYQFSYSYY